MINYTNEELLDGILANDNIILQHIYKHFYSKINFFIQKNNGDDDDSSDIFQEAIIIIYRKLKASDLVLQCSFETYLYSVCRFLWLKQLEKRKNEKERIIDNNQLTDEIYANDFETTVELNEKYKLYQKHFKNLKSDCQKILQLFFDKVPLKQIAQIMGYQSEKYAKKCKYKCKESLVRNIKQDPEFEQLMDNH